MQQGILIYAPHVCQNSLFSAYREPYRFPIVASALKLDLPNYAPEECPICKEGKLPLVHLGSRKMKQEAKQTL